MKRHRFAPRARVAELFVSAAAVDPQRFRADLDRGVDQDASPRA